MTDLEKKAEIVEVNETGEVVDDYFIIVPKTPVIFEGKTYDKIDLTGLKNVRAADMIAVNRMLNRQGNMDYMQEMTLEYAINLAAKATGKPIEFFEQLPPYLAMAVKNRVTSFLYRQV